MKELRETLFWIEVSRKAKLLVPERVDGLVKETNELVAIGVKSVLTAKKNAEMPK